MNECSVCVPDPRGDVLWAMKTAGCRRWCHDQGGDGLIDPFLGVSTPGSQLQERRVFEICMSKGQLEALKAEGAEEAGAGQTEAEGTGTVCTPQRKTTGLGAEQGPPREFGAWPL